MTDVASRWNTAFDNVETAEVAASHLYSPFIVSFTYLMLFT